MSDLLDYRTIFTRPDDSELMPVGVLWQTGGSYRDYICAGLAPARDVLDWQRGSKPKEWRLLMWEPRTIIKYNKESGSLRGLFGHGPKSGGYGVATSLDCPACMGIPLELSLVPLEVWEQIRDWAPVS